MFRHIEGMIAETLFSLLRVFDLFSKFYMLIVLLITLLRKLVFFFLRLQTRQLILRLLKCY